MIKDPKTEILKASAKIFSEKGYSKATVREICREAGVNLALVNYHFGDKENLYKTLILNTFAELSKSEKTPPIQGSTPLAKLKEMIYHTILKVSDPDIPVWLEKILDRELLEESPLKEIIFNEVISKDVKILESCISEYLEMDKDSKEIKLLIGNIMGMFLFYRKTNPIYVYIMKKNKIKKEEALEFSEFVFDFIVHGLKGIKRKNQ